MMTLPDIRTADVAGKRVFLRTDCNVPLVAGRIEDDTRLLADMPTIEYLLEKDASIIIAGHLGQPQSKYPISNIQFQISNEDKHLSLLPVAKWFAEELRIKNQESGMEKIGGFDGWKMSNNVFLLENLRFYEGEEKNNQEFSQKLSSLADIYVNDAFDVDHRAHASIIGVPKLLPHFAGLQLLKEVEHLSKVIENPVRPLVVVIGGAKIETKLPLVTRMLAVADNVLVGGKIAAEAKGRLEPHEKLLVAESTPDGTDVTQESVAAFVQHIAGAKTIVWNGPLGKTGDDTTEQRTLTIATAIAGSSAYTVVGGGDTLEFLRRHNLLDKFSFVSTGGGAMLAFLSGEKLPGLEALK